MENLIIGISLTVLGMIVGYIIRKIRDDIIINGLTYCLESAQDDLNDIELSKGTMEEKGGDGGDLTFQSGCGGKPTKNGIKAKDGDINFVIGEDTSNPILKLCSNGDLLIKGNIAENDKSIVSAFRKFVMAAEIIY